MLIEDDALVALCRLVISYGSELPPDGWKRIVRSAYREAQNNTASRREDRKEARVAAKMVAWQLRHEYFLYGWTLHWLAHQLREHRRAQLPARPEVDEVVYLATLISTGLVGSTKEAASVFGRLKERFAQESPTARSPYWLAAGVLTTLNGLSKEDACNVLAGILQDDHPEATDAVSRITGDSYGKSLRRFRAAFAQRIGWQVPGAQPGHAIEFEELDVISRASVQGQDFWDHVFVGFLPAYSRRAGCETSPPLGSLLRPPRSHASLFHGLVCGSCLRLRGETKPSWKGDLRLPVRPNSGAPSSGAGGGTPADVESLALELKTVCQADQQARATAQGRLRVSLDGGPLVDSRLDATYAAQRSVELFVNDVSVLWHEVTPPGSLDYPVRSNYQVGTRTYAILQSRNGITVSETAVGKVTESGGYFAASRLGLALAAVLVLYTGMVFSTQAPTVVNVRLGEAADAGKLGTKVTQNVELILAQSPRPWLRSTYELEIQDKAEHTISCPAGPVTRGSSTLSFTCGAGWNSLVAGDLDVTLLERRWGWPFSRTTYNKFAK